MSKEYHPRYIELPAGDVLKSRLDKKLSEYEARIDGEGKDWKKMPPVFAHQLFPSYRDACYKAYALRTVKKAKVRADTWEMSKEMQKRWGSNFKGDEFCNACGVVDYYCGNVTDPKEQLIGGTGLPAA